VDVMELMFAEWEDGERFSFEDSDRFEEDSLCSFISEAESLCQNWRGWRKQSAGPNSPTVKIKGLEDTHTHTLSFILNTLSWKDFHQVSSSGAKVHRMTC